MKQLNTDVFDTFPILKTERLTLREIRIEDAKEILAMRSNGNTNRFISRPLMEEITEAEQLIGRVQSMYETRQAIAWAGLLRDSGTIIGTCGLINIDLPNLRAEIGGELNVQFWGKHIAVEAVKAIVGFGFGEFGLHAIEAKVSPANRGAIFLLEQLGFEKEAHFRDRVYYDGRFSDLAVYTAFAR